MIFGTQKHEESAHFVSCGSTNLGAHQKRWWRMWPTRSLSRSRLPPRLCRWWEMTAPWSCIPAWCWAACGRDEIHSCRTPPRRSGTLKNNFTEVRGPQQWGLVFLLKHSYTITHRLVNSCICKVCWWFSYSIVITFHKEKKKVNVTTG